MVGVGAVVGEGVGEREAVGSRRVGEGVAAEATAGVGAACTWVAGTEQPPSRSRHET